MEPMQLLATMATGYAIGCVLGGAVLEDVLPALAMPLAIAGIFAGLLVGLYRPGPWLQPVNLTTWLAVMPAWGFWINHRLPGCTHGCESTYRAIDGAGIWVVALSYLLGLAAYGLHRRRPEALHPGLEALLFVAMGQAVLTCVVLTGHFAVASFMGVVLGPIGLPLISPSVGGLVLIGAAYQRMRRLGSPHTWQSGGLLAASLGVWSLATWARGPYLGGISQTCGWALSELTPPPEDCHYLCTIAAQGSPWLVGPHRMGVRRGRPIVVNRQLAVANAFEDLLHERWPRFGAWARRTYDRLAFDVTQTLRNPHIANIVFVAMLPAQLVFEVFLAAFDPGDIEVRIDRMYR
jgi:hypothetical protein